MFLTDSFAVLSSSAYAHYNIISFVRVDGIEPSTSVLSGQRSTTELHAQILLRDAPDLYDIIYFFQKLHASVFFN